MNRRIIGFHPDDFGDWVADLECNHGVHVRHQPPFQLRPWVVTAEGRQSRIGAGLDCRKCETEPAYIAENRALVRRYYDELWNQWRFELIDRLIAPDFRFRGSIGTETRGRQAFAEYMRTIQRAFPDFHNSVEGMIGEDNRVVARLTYTGTNRGRIFDIDPSGVAVSYAGVAIFTLGASLLRSAWVLGDRYELMRQLGARFQA